LLGGTGRIDALSDPPALLYILNVGSATLRVVALEKDVIVIPIPCCQKKVGIGRLAVLPTRH